MKCFSYLTTFSNSVWQKPNCDFSSYLLFLHFPKDTMSYVKTSPLTNTLTVHIFTHTLCTLVHICNSDQGVQANVLRSNRHGSITCHFSAFPLSPGLGPCGTNSQDYPHNCLSNSTARELKTSQVNKLQSYI